MKKFFIYHSRSNDLLMTVDRIHRRAAAHARKIKNTVAIIDVDVDTATGDVLGCYSRTGTIECVTATSTGCKQRAMNPIPTKINCMIDRV